MFYLWIYWIDIVFFLQTRTSNSRVNRMKWKIWSRNTIDNSANIVSMTLLDNNKLKVLHKQSAYNRGIFTKFRVIWILTIDSHRLWLVHNGLQLKSYKKTCSRILVICHKYEQKMKNLQLVWKWRFRYKGMPMCSASNLFFVYWVKVKVFRKHGSFIDCTI